MNNPLKLVILSDTHSNFGQFQQLIDEKITGDFFIYAGDFTRYGRQQHFLKFFEWLEILPFKHKIVIAGNHEVSLDNKMISERKRNQIKQKYSCKYDRQFLVNQLKKRCVYLQHQMVQIEGIKIFGSPYTQYYSKGAFQYPKDQDQFIWSTLPNNIDLLITHSPPYGILDVSGKNVNGGSVALRKKAAYFWAYSLIAWQSLIRWSYFYECCQRV